MGWVPGCLRTWGRNGHTNGDTAFAPLLKLELLTKDACVTAFRSNSDLSIAFQYTLCYRHGHLHAVLRGGYIRDSSPEYFQQ
jgi:hypothetical protein